MRKALIKFLLLLIFIRFRIPKWGKLWEWCWWSICRYSFLLWYTALLILDFDLFTPQFRGALTVYIYGFDEVCFISSEAALWCLFLVSRSLRIIILDFWDLSWYFRSLARLRIIVCRLIYSIWELNECKRNHCL